MHRWRRCRIVRYCLNLFLFYTKPNGALSRNFSYFMRSAFQPSAAKAHARIIFSGPQSVKKVEVQEALPPAGVIGAEPLTLLPQHFPRKPA